MAKTRAGVIGNRTVAGCRGQKRARRAAHVRSAQASRRERRRGDDLLRAWPALCEFRTRRKRRRDGCHRRRALLQHRDPRVRLGRGERGNVGRVLLGGPGGSKTQMTNRAGVQALFLLAVASCASAPGGSFVLHFPALSGVDPREEVYRVGAEGGTAPTRRRVNSLACCSNAPTSESPRMPTLSPPSPFRSRGSR